MTEPTAPLDQHCDICHSVARDVTATRRLLEGWTNDEGVHRDGLIQRHNARFEGLERDVLELKQGKAWWKLTLVDVSKLVAAAVLGGYINRHHP
jgi:hypothetical protein